MHAHNDTNKKQISQKYTPNPSMCLVSHQGTCCQSDSYVRLGEWKQSRNNTQYGSECLWVFMCTSVWLCVWIWIQSSRDRTLYSANTFLEGLHVEKSSRSSVTKKWLTARMTYSGKESILTLVMRLLNLNQSFSKVNVCKDYLLQRGASTSRVTWRWFVLLFRAHSLYNGNSKGNVVL